MILTLKSNTFIIPWHSIVTMHVAGSYAVLTLTRGVEEVQMDTPERAMQFLKALTIRYMEGEKRVDLQQLKIDIMEYHAYAKDNNESTIVPGTDRDISGTIAEELGEDTARLLADGPADDGVEGTASTVGSDIGTEEEWISLGFSGTWPGQDDTEDAPDAGYELPSGVGGDGTDKDIELPESTGDTDSILFEGVPPKLFD